MELENPVGLKGKGLFGAAVPAFPEETIQAIIRQDAEGVFHLFNIKFAIRRRGVHSAVGGDILPRDRVNRRSGG